MSEPIHLDIKPADGGTSELNREKKQTLAAVAEVMDMSVPLPVDENVINYSDQINEKTATSKIEEAKTAITQTISDKKSATLVKARAAKAEKAKIARLAGKDMAQGSKTPDVLTQLAKMLDERFASVNKRFDDYQTTIAHESPLQANGVPNIHGKRYRQESLAQSDTFLDLDHGDEFGKAVPLTNGIVAKESLNRASKIPRISIDENNKAVNNYENRNRNQSKIMQYENDQTEERARKDGGMGGKTSEQNQYIMF